MNYTKPDFVVNVYLPSLTEINSYLNQPSTLSKGNENDLEAIAKLRGYDDKWSSDKSLRWTIPEDHPGQDRPLCLNLTKTLSSGRSTPAFYDSLKASRRLFYTITVRNALIHPTG
jgi:hypothetical protein